MKAIVTRNYKTLRNLIRYGISEKLKENGAKLEIYIGDNIYCEPQQTIYI